MDTNYRVIFERDFYETFTGFLANGDLAEARQQTMFIFDKVELPDGSFPRDALVNGSVASDNYVLEPDEQAFPRIMAWQSGLGSDHELYTAHVRPAADYLVAHGPVYGDERWEDQTGYSPSTIATEIAGLVAAGGIAQPNGDRERAALYLATADYDQRTSRAGLSPPTAPTAASPTSSGLSKTGDPDTPVVNNLGNGSISADQRAVVDDGFLELARFGEIPATAPVIRNSLKVADSVLETDTPSGPGYHRYGTRDQSVNGTNIPVTGSTDGYGDCYAPDPMHCPLTGRPWIPWFTGTGHVWPLLNGERGEQDLQSGDPSAASQQLAAIANFADGVGMIPEQDWEDPGVPASLYGSDPTTASIGFTDGQGTGSACYSGPGPRSSGAPHPRHRDRHPHRSAVHRPEPVCDPRRAHQSATDYHGARQRRDRHYAHHDRDGDGGTGREGGHRLDAVTSRRHRRGRHSALRPGAHQHH